MGDKDNKGERTRGEEMTREGHPPPSWLGKGEKIQNNRKNVYTNREWEWAPHTPNCTFMHLSALPFVSTCPLRKRKWLLFASYRCLACCTFSFFLLPPSTFPPPPSPLFAHLYFWFLGSTCVGGNWDVYTIH